MASNDEFYEADEPVDKIIEAFNRGEKGVTGRPTWSNTSYLKLPGRVEQIISNLTNKSTRELPAH
ncbi:hypothetical protein O7626_41380 [Micromonospora sp. WMMD1102]|uniref:hypothetical protein n=1 Tax=Micromonosporaceae TaxID=28056 RepID=UPI0024150DF4|nr:hypothetical protein [Micromonospora sp. WMMD1102]MDG4791049.1 hypothetical protein [Micromonospora sp. WMMD1102]MDG4792244.1 hypothetical protein [Micromonospora sp. WMMD1102]MDG4792259.1 hypothetical protein [Micromonospora sp. WMMD1102]